MSHYPATRGAAILLTLLRDYSRRAWWRLLNAQIAVLGVAVVVYSSLLQGGPLEASSGRTLHMIFLWSVLVAAGGAASTIRGDSRRFYRCPLSNTALSVLILLPGMLSVAGCWICVAVVLNSLFDVGWPIAGPALFMAALWGAIQTASRAIESHRLGKSIACVLITIAFGAWLCGRYEGPNLLGPKTMWSMQTTDWLQLGGAIALEFWLMPFSIARDRCAQSGIFLRPSSIRLSRETTTKITWPAFRTATRAQFWFEWRQKGWVLPITLALFSFVLLAGYGCRMYDEYELLHSGMGFGMGLVPLSIMLGLVLGHVDLVRKSVECGGFLGTRPSTNWQLSTALLKVEAVSLLLTWGLWCLGLAAATVVLQVAQGIAPVEDLWTDHGKFVPEYAAVGGWFAGVPLCLCLVLSWIGMSLSTSLALAGRPNWQVASVIGATPLFVLSMALASADQNGWRLLSPQAYETTGGTLAILFFVAMLVLARQRNVIDDKTIASMVFVWLFAAGFAAHVMWHVGWWNGASVVLMLGVFALSVTPWAAAPLALSWNRHR